MERDLCWFGFTSHLDFWRNIVERDLGRKIQAFTDAVDGLKGRKGIDKFEYPIILFNTPTPAGKLELPAGVYLEDWILTDCYIINCARKIRPKTPIIVTHSAFFEKYSPSMAVKKYKEAGATSFINHWKLEAEKPFIDFIKKYL